MKTTNRAPVWNYLLIGAFAVTAGLMFLLIAAVFLVPRAIDRTIEKYTDAAPQSGIVSDVSDREYEDLQERVERFGEAVDTGQRSQPLVLTSDEVAALIQREVQSELNKQGDPPPVRLWLGVDGNRLKGPVSIYLDEFATGMLDRLQGRYLNGIATLDVRLADGRFHVRLDDFAIDGDPIPGWVRNALQDAIDKAVADSDELRDVGRKLGGLEIYDDKVVVRTPQ